MDDDEQVPGGGIAVTPAADGSLVTMWGDVDATLRDQASASMAEVVGRGGPVVIDLAEVSFIDSSALAFILQLNSLGDEKSAQQLTLRNPPSIVLDLLEMVGLDGQVPLDFSPGDEAGDAGEGTADEAAPGARPAVGRHAPSTVAPVAPVV